MTQVKSFRDLNVWQVSMDLAEACFDIVEAIPHPYRFSFANQLIPAAYPGPLLMKGVVLIDPVGTMLHGLAASLNACNERRS